MSLDERLRHHLRAHADRTPVRAGGSARIAAAARRRRQRQRLLATGATVALVGIGLIVWLPDNEGSSDVAVGVETTPTPLEAPSATAAPANATATPQAATVEPTPGHTPGVAPFPSGSATMLLSAPQGIVVVTDDGRDVWLWPDLDGQPTRLPDPRPAADGSVVELVQHEQWLYAAGQTPTAGGGSELWVARTDDLTTWQAVATDVAETTPASNAIETWSTSLQSLAAGPAGVLVTAERTVELDEDRIVGRDVDDADTNYGSPDTDDAGSLVVTDPVTGESESIDLADAGVSSAAIESLDGGSIPLVLTGSPTDTLRASDVAPGPVITKAAASSAGFLGAAFLARYNDTVLHQSADGSSWESLAISVLALDGVDTIGTVAGRPLVAATQGRFLYFRSVDADGVWQEEPVHDHVSHRVGESVDLRLVAGSFGTSGYVALVTSESADGTVHLVAVSTTDAVTWTVTDVGAALDAATLEAMGAVALDGDRVVVARTDAAGVIDLIAVPVGS